MKISAVYLKYTFCNSENVAVSVKAKQTGWSGSFFTYNNFSIPADKVLEDLRDIFPRVSLLKVCAARSICLLFVIINNQQSGHKRYKYTFLLTPLQEIMFQTTPQWWHTFYSCQDYVMQMSPFNFWENLKTPLYLWLRYIQKTNLCSFSRKYRNFTIWWVFLGHYMYVLYKDRIKALFICAVEDTSNYRKSIFVALPLCWHLHAHGISINNSFSVSCFHWY